MTNPKLSQAAKKERVVPPAVPKTQRAAVVKKATTGLKAKAPAFKK